jgi:hypothetical protein
MSLARDLTAGALSAAGSFLILQASGCGTDAVGVDECRDIEQARCEAGQHCEIFDEVHDDVDACRRFYRDQCLHGLTVVSPTPGRTAVDTCVKAIRSAGQCAVDKGTLLSSCDPADVPRPVPGQVLRTACDVVLYPEKTLECEFLAPASQVTPPRDAAAEASSPDASPAGGGGPGDAS